MDDPTRQRFKELIRDLDPETREIVWNLVRRFVPLEQIIEVIEKRRQERVRLTGEGTGG